MNFDRLRIIDVSRLCQLAFHTAENLFSPQKTGVLQASNMRVPGFRGSSNPSNPGFSAKGVAKLRRQLRRVNRLKYSIWSTGSSCLVNGVGCHARIDSGVTIEANLGQMYQGLQQNQIGAMGIVPA